MTPLSKSRLLAFRQCPKRLWLDAHMPELLQTADSTQARYAAGHRLGEVARQIFDPSGHGLAFDVMAQGAASVVAQTQLEIARTPRTLAQRSPLFEAGFEAAGARVFVDVLMPVPTPRNLPPRWGIVEVKSATSLKDVYLDDAAIQYFVATQSGLALDCIAIATVNSDWVLAKKGHYDGLLQQHDATQDIQNLVMEVPHWVKAAQAVLKRRTPPVLKTGAQCASPYTCAYVAHCQSQEPVVENPVQWLPRVQTKALRAHLAQPAVRGMEDVPDVYCSTRSNCVSNKPLCVAVRGGIRAVQRRPLPRIRHRFTFSTLKPWPMPCPAGWGHGPISKFHFSSLCTGWGHAAVSATSGFWIFRVKTRAWPSLRLWLLLATMAAPYLPTTPVLKPNVWRNWLNIWLQKLQRAESSLKHCLASLIGWWIWSRLCERTITTPFRKAVGASRLCCQPCCRS